MSFHGYVSFKGSKQGQFKGETKTTGRQDKWTDVVAFKMQSETPFDVKTGQTTGRRTHDPLTITRLIDNATPKLVNAFGSGEMFSEMVIEVVEATSTGREQVTERITLTNATISNVRHYVGENVPHYIGKASLTDRVLTDFGFTFQKIQVEDFHRR